MSAHLVAKQGPFEGLILQFDEGEDWIIGRDPDEADFVLEDSTVSRKHARITRTESGLTIRNLSRINPTLVNGQTHEDDTWLSEGDEIQIGDTTFLFSESLRTDAETKEEAPPFKEPDEPSAYDTIFEDLEPENDLPFHMIPDTPLLLKVISGPNAGAEIGVETDRTYVLGKDPNTCDVVFQDLSVSRNHARLHIDADGIADIEDLGSKNGTLINGHPALEKTVITPQDVIALGTTLFLFIDREAPQETIFSSVLPALEMQKEPKASVQEGPVEEIREEVRLGDWKKTKIPSKYLVAASSFALIFFVIFISFFSLFKSSTLEIVQKEPVEEIQLALHAFPAVQFSFNPASGKLFLVGHVQSAVQFQEMLYNIDQIPFISDVENTVIIDDALSKMMNDLLSSHPTFRSVNISATQPGQFVASGYVQTAAEGQALRDYLLANFPYPDKLTNRVAIEEVLNVQISGLMLSHGFGSVAFQLSQGSILLSGVYSEEKKKEYEALLKELNSLPGIYSVKNFATPISHEMARIDLSQQYQVTGFSLLDGRGYSVVINGKVLVRGEAIDGMKITSIESNTILLEKDGLKYTINYAPPH